MQRRAGRFLGLLERGLDGAQLLGDRADVARLRADLLTGLRRAGVDLAPELLAGLARGLTGSVRHAALVPGAALSAALVWRAHVNGKRRALAA
mgnify:CR=1 FL=1